MSGVETGGALFDTGKMTVTLAASALVPDEGERAELLLRHVSGDYGSITEEDALDNENAIALRGLILSVYDVSGGVVWIATLPGHGSTTMMLPDEW